MHVRRAEFHKAAKWTDGSAVPRHLPLGLMARAVIAGLIVLVSCRQADAQADTAKAEPQPSASKQPKAIQPAVSPGKLAPKAGGGCGDKSTAATKLAPATEEAKWVCEETKITKEGIWRGQPIVCDFAIRNDGTKDLTFTARGG